MSLLRAMHAEESVEPVDENKVRYILQRLLYQSGGVVGVIRGKDGIEGTVGIALDTVWYSSAQHLKKLWLFVHPDCRKSTHAKSMLEFSKYYADHVGVPLMTDEICGPNTEAKVKLVSRQLNESGKTFLYNRRETLIAVSA
jgi:hypothetical protein